jgi:excisionase family DNA binding protein
MGSVVGVSSARVHERSVEGALVSADEGPLRFLKSVTASQARGAGDSLALSPGPFPSPHRTHARPDGPRSRVARVGDLVDVSDRITYAEAIAITGRSHRYLSQLVAEGALTREGGNRGAGSYHTWLSRTEVEGLALSAYRRGRATDYWRTVAQTAAMVGVTRQAVQQAVEKGRLPAQRSRIGHWLIRRDDVLRLSAGGEFPGPVGRKRAAGNHRM